MKITRTSQLLAMSFDSSASPSITFKDALEPERQAAGWGFAWYPTDDHAAVVIKEPRAPRETAMTAVLRDWDRFRSSVFVCHLRGAAKRVTQQDTHPFVRSYAGHSFLFAHAGDLEGDLQRLLPLGENPVFEPLGRTDSERAFCWLLTRIRDSGARNLSELGWTTLHGWLRNLDDLGTANFLFTDGRDLVGYHDGSGSGTLHWIRRSPPHRRTLLGNEYMDLDLSDPLDLNRTMVFLSTSPLSDEDWTPLEAGQMIVVRLGTVRWLSELVAPVPAGAPRPENVPLAPHPDAPTSIELLTCPVPGATLQEASATQSRFHALAGPIPIAVPGLAGQPARETVAARREEPSRELRVIHETIYRYEEPVERSTHVLRLRPVHDVLQDVIEFRCEISPDGDSHEFEDVFGNQSIRVKLETPYRELRILTSSRVRVHSPSCPHQQLGSVTMPLVWMPWQRQMMLPYLLPPELPETQLRELSEFAMSFVRRQDNDLMETLVDMNQSIYTDFRYVSGSTTLETTPFDVYTQRQGVCQDFANLLICLARLLGIPARYRVGYIHTGAGAENRIQSEASHAWVELYLPGIGWRGFDPTNGCLAGTDHVRVATGRNYRDATPTQGTLYKGGGDEMLHVSVKVALLG